MYNHLHYSSSNQYQTNEYTTALTILELIERKDEYVHG